MNVQTSNNGKIIDVTLSESNLIELSNMWQAITDFIAELKGSAVLKPLQGSGGAGVFLVPVLKRRVEGGQLLIVRIESDLHHYAGR